MGYDFIQVQHANNDAEVSHLTSKVVVNYVFLLWTEAPFPSMGLLFIQPWIINYILYIVWDEITYPFLNFNGCTVQLRECLSSYTARISRHVITFPCMNKDNPKASQASHLKQFNRLNQTIAHAFLNGPDEFKCFKFKKAIIRRAMRTELWNLSRKRCFRFHRRISLYLIIYCRSRIQIINVHMHTLLSRKELRWRHNQTLAEWHSPRCK